MYYGQKTAGISGSVYSQQGKAVDSPRRGVTLFIVLALMMMFMMLVVAFMVITTQARRRAEHMAHALVEEPKNGNNPTVAASDAEKALEKLLVGDKLESVIGPHSILENLYGHPAAGNDNSNDNLSCTITGNGTQDNNYLEITLPVESNWYSGTFGLFGLFGNVLTVTDVPNSLDPAKKERLQKIKGKSTFIISYGDVSGLIALDTSLPGPDSFTLQIAPFSGVTLSVNDLQGCRVIINSPAFGGTGPGIKTTTAVAGEAALTENNSSSPFALRPNILAPNPYTSSYKTYLQDNLVLMNPDYTAPDYLNMFLAWNDIQHNGSKWVINKTVPSFHRPQLLRYWLRVSLNNQDSSKLRSYFLRPLPLDHPKFTGSNPAAEYSSTPSADRLPRLLRFLTDGPWDVDNDGDGIADGVWIDAGLGTTTVNGRTYKKLVSYYVLDMDGRVNVNTHGNLEQLSTNFECDDPNQTSLLTGTQYGGLPLRGAGSGPAEVRFDLAVNTVTGNTDGQTVLQNLLTSATANSEGRYGNDTVPGDNATFPSGIADIIEWGKENMGINLQTYAGYQQNPQNFNEREFSGLGDIVPDWWGKHAIMFDPIGNRYFGAVYPQHSDLHLSTIHQNNPYLMNPYTNSGYDRLFDPSDLQAVLRSFGDIDYTAQPQRLRTILESTNFSPYTLSPYRLFFTTRSSDIPVTSAFDNRIDASGNLAKGLYYYIFNSICNKSIGMTGRFYEFLPEEIKRGEKVNLNRLTLLSEWQKISTNANTGVNSEAVLIEKAKFARSIFYLLFVLNYDKLYTQPNGEGTMTYVGENLTREQVITRLAQWSVNLVDFIDPDDVMTPLVYSIDPLKVRTYNDGNSSDDVTKAVYENRWTPPTGQSYKLVWGMEKPEVAITETLAIHNRRVADSVKENSSAGTCPKCNKSFARMSHDCEDSADHDSDFDQVMIPQGSLFVELYRQGNPHRAESSPVGNAVAYNNPDGPSTLDLAQQVPTPSNNPSYVWRLVISEKNCGNTPEFDWNTGTHDQDALYQLKNNGTTCSFQTKQWPVTTIKGCFDDEAFIVPERIIWFGKTVPYPQHGADDATIRKHSYSQNTYNLPATLSPNSYLVIAPSASVGILSQPVDGVGSTEFGKTKSPVPDHGIAVGANRFYPSLPPDPDNPNSKLPKTPTVIYASTPHPDNSSYNIGVSVSEPLRDNYYTPLPSYPNQPYSPALESPLDKDELESYGTIPCYRTICLQRLADPSRQHHPMTNPYVTVDWNMIDLHVINSEQDANGSEDPIFADDQKHGNLYLNSRQWGTIGSNETKKSPNLWARNFKTTQADGSELTNKTVGYLDIGTAQTNGAVALDTDRMSLGYLNKYPNVAIIRQDTITNLELTSMAARALQGAPDKAFLHFPWHNSPLTNSYELMLIPASPPDRFGVEFYDNESADWVNTATTQSLGSGLRFSDPNNGLGAYLNFFGGGLNLSRLFEYVRVPSKFGGTIRGWVTDNDGNLVKPVYEMREPGKINLNTATAPAWEALRGNSSRQNWHEYNNSNNNGLYALRHKEAVDNIYPSEFIPFRSPQAVTLVPPLARAGQTNDLVQQPVNATLLRSGLLEPEPDADNPYTALENYMRLSDMTTTRSNVFAVWMTIGYFEAEHFSTLNDLKQKYPTQLSHIYNSDTFQFVYPDGYVLGVEKGLDNGTVKRHRAFYLIDRSIPVGFRRGTVFQQSNGDPHYKPVIIGSKILE